MYVVAFLAVVNLDFFIPRALPGSAATIFATSVKLSPDAVQKISERLGLNQPLAVQYEIYLKGIFTHFPPSFGFSYQYYPTSVTHMILIRFPWTLLLVISGFAIAVTLAFFVAVITVRKRGGKSELTSFGAAITFWSTPAFWLGLVLIWIFGVFLRWFPDGNQVGFNLAPGSLAYYGSIAWHAVLPTVTLAAVFFGESYVILRGATQEALKNDYVIAAKARGLKENAVALGYVIRNSMLPFVALTGYILAQLMSISVFVEYVFGYNGVGDLLADAIFARDYPILEGAFFYITVMVIILAFLGDIAMTRLDPRIR